ncbi:hypothetical protein GTU99_09825 [Streptomyces sp. PRKS01-65]|nr:hypothetical protein [Streptomyces harenosi]NEY32486.1 hypothetical protein [Streptomyces harenosi]
MFAATLSPAALLAGCTRQEPGPAHATRSPAQAAWHVSTPEERASHCDAYRRHDPQHPVTIPPHRSDQTDEEFADDFYAVLEKEC